jgi:hypothetical protein
MHSSIGPIERALTGRQVQLGVTGVYKPKFRTRPRRAAFRPASVTVLATQLEATADAAPLVCRASRVLRLKLGRIMTGTSLKSKGQSDRGGPEPGAAVPAASPRYPLATSNSSRRGGDIGKRAPWSSETYVLGLSAQSSASALWHRSVYMRGGRWGRHQPSPVPKWARPGADVIRITASM